MVLVRELVNVHETNGVEVCIGLLVEHLPLGQDFAKSDIGS